MASELVAPDGISQTLAKFKPNDLIEVISGLRQVAQQNPGQARAVLEQNGDLSYALLQALFLMGLIDEHVIADAMKASHISPSQSSVSNGPAESQNGSAARSTPPPAASQSTPQTTEEKLQALDPKAADLIRQVLNMTEEQINSMGEVQQQQVRELRKQYS